MPPGPCTHNTLTNASVTSADGTMIAYERHGNGAPVIVGSLRLTYHFTDPSAGFLVGFGAIPTQLVRTACRAFAQALAQIEERHLSE